MISRLIHYLTRNTPDPSWQATGVRYTTPLHYDEAQGQRGRERSLRRQAAVRKVSDAGERRVIHMDRRGA